jgi:hypothetical protein
LIVNTLIALSVMIVTSTIFAAMQAEHHIEDFFVGSFALTIGSVAATVAVVLRRTWRESSPAFPVISGNLSWSSATQYSPILVAQVLGFGFPFLFSPGVDFSRFEYALSAFAGIFLGYLVFLLLLPRSNRRWVLIGLGYATFGLVLVMIFGAMFDQQNNEDFTYGMIKITRETDRAISATFPRALGSGLRAAGLFLGIAWLMGLRSILLQRIHESEVLNHPIGALSMDAVTDYPTNGTARV